MATNTEKAVVSTKPIDKEQIKSKVEEIAGKMDAETKKMLEEALYKTVVERVPKKEALGLDDKKIENLYQEGYNQFQAGRYNEAIKTFRVLQELDPNQYRYSFAIGAALQYQKKYNEAVGAYLMAASIDEMNPIPHYHIYDCFVKTNQLTSAMWAITEALYWAKLDKKYESLAAKAEMEQKHLLDLINTVYGGEASEGQKGE